MARLFIPSPTKVARACAALMLALALAGGLAACGKRGDPEPPPGKKDEFPRTYPDPTTYPGPKTY